ncbi:hypothetical protein [Rhizobacter sp. P5_C2]
MSGTDELSFHPNRSKKPRAFGAIRIGKGASSCNYRITHVFTAHIYLMPVTTAAGGHDASRPKRRSIREIDKLVDEGKAVYGSIRLPPEMTVAIKKGDRLDELASGVLAQIRPLLDLFARESELGRSFTSEIEAQAESQGVPLPTLRRALLRYWYFGAMKQALLVLRRGPKISVQTEAQPSGQAKVKHIALHMRRAGPKPRHAAGVRPCEWRPEAIDVADMEHAAIRCATRKLKGLQALTDQYLNHEFKRRHPQVFERFMKGSMTVPCTERQLRYRLRRKAALDPRVLTAFPALRRPASERALLAVGSGHIYELDATGGQIYIVDSNDPTRILRKVTIYLLIDRYSRYVVSVYITAKPPSSAGVRQTLRIAFTSRNRRFPNMGVDIDDNDWPPGVMCLSMVVDNGPDMISKATLKTAVEDLLIDVDILPPYTPDGKAIIERFIKTLKVKMQAKGLAGLYKKVQLSPEEKRTAKDAVFLAEHSLRSLYREIIEIIRTYNHSNHTGIEERLPELAAAGVPFTPIAAYRYGLENVSGLERPTISDEDIFQLTLGTQKASIRDGVITWEGLSYYPASAGAVAFGAHCGSVRKSIDVKIDATDPVELFVMASMSPLPMWKLDKHGEAFVRAVCMEDWEEFSEERGTQKADTARRNTIMRLQASGSESGAKAPRRKAKVMADTKTVQRRSVEESNALDAGLSARRATRKLSKTQAQPVAPSKACDFRLAEATRLEAIAKRRGPGGKR